MYSCYLGIGFGSGTIIGGFLMDIIGGSWTFLLFGGVTAIVIFLLLVSMAVTKLLERQQQDQTESETEYNVWK